jgi:hypothetical protein
MLDERTRQQELRLDKESRLTVQLQAEESKLADLNRRLDKIEQDLEMRLTGDTMKGTKKQ